MINNLEAERRRVPVACMRLITLVLLNYLSICLLIKSQ